MCRIRFFALLFALCALLSLTGCCGDSVPEASAQETEENVQMEEIYGCKAIPLEDLGDRTVLDVYLAARAEGQKSGFFPMIVYEDERLTELFEYQFEIAGGREAFIASVLAGDHSGGKERLQAMYQELEAMFGSEALEIRDEELSDLLTQAGRRRSASDFPSFMTSFYGSPYLLQVPAEQPWEIFAWLPNCGWNTCPDVDNMIAVCRYWYEAFGAVPALMNFDTLILYLDDPVTDLETAKALALEQTAFCDGIFEADGPVTYAASMLNSHFWVFWWD